MIPRIFEGRTCFIVAGGPSLSGFDFGRLSGKSHIAINRAYEVCPEAHVLWWSDALFFRARRSALLAHPAPYKATLRLGYQEDERAGLELYEASGLDGFDEDPHRLRHGNNSAYAAIHLAAHLGASRIVLLGVDMRHDPKGKTHWHSGHGKVHLQQTLTELMLPYFASLRKPLARLGIEVLNASPGSLLDVWPKITLEEAMRL